MIANLSLILMLASQVASIPYNPIAYNCWDYATDLRIALAEKNISSEIITGIFNHQAHDWLDVQGVWIEATDGQLITNRSEYHAGYYSFNKFNPLKQQWKSDFLEKSDTSKHEMNV
jgi:hypothetical protein